MTASLLSPSLAAAPPRRQLFAATLLVMALHALLLVGLPELGRQVRPGEQGTAFVTRLIAPPAPAPAAMPAPPQAQPAPAVTAPRPAPPPRVRPAAPPRPPPKPAAPAPAVAEPLPAPAPSPAPTETAPSSASASSTATGAPPAEPSLLGPRPPGSFGGGLAAQAITPPLAGADAAAALQWAASAGDAPTALPPAAILNYRTQVSIGGQSATVTTSLNWRQDGQQYEARWPLYGPRFGDHSRRSRGLLAPQGLVPVDATLRTSDAQTVRFDHLAQQLVYPDGPVPLRPGTQDRLSVLLQLAALLAGDAARYPVGSRIELPAAHAHGAGNWRFEVEAEERLVAPTGQELPTLRLVHTPLDGRDARIELWLARGVHYLPVRVRVTEANGDTVEHTMLSAFTQQVPRHGTSTP